MVTRTRRELGISVNSGSGPNLFAVDAAILKGALARISPAFQQASIDARVALVNKQPTVVSGTYTRKLDIERTLLLITDTVTKDPTFVRFTVRLTKTPPVLSQERLAGINAILGQMTTQTSDVPKRNLNISIATQAIDGTLLSPGEMFSLNEVVGKRTQARGYRTATVFVDGQKADGIGGGVPQVPGTLLSAAALPGRKCGNSTSASQAGPSSSTAAICQAGCGIPEYSASTALTVSIRLMHTRGTTSRPSMILPAISRAARGRDASTPKPLE